MSDSWDWPPVPPERRCDFCEEGPAIIAEIDLDQSYACCSYCLKHSGVPLPWDPEKRALTLIGFEHDHHQRSRLPGDSV